MRPYTPGRLGPYQRPTLRVDPATYLGVRHSSGHLNMPLLGHRAPFNAPPFRTQHTVKNVVLTGGRDVASCEARVAVVCWRTVYIVVLLSRVTTTWSPRTKMPGPLHLTIQARIRTSPGCAMSSSVRAAAHRRRRVASGSFPARTSPAGIGTLTKIGSFSQVRTPWYVSSDVRVDR